MPNSFPWPPKALDSDRAVTQKGLISAISSMANVYSRVLIIVDAVDEAKETGGFRGDLIKSLAEIQSGERINLFFKSRFGSDAKDMLTQSRCNDERLGSCLRDFTLTPFPVPRRQNNCDLR